MSNVRYLGRFKMNDGRVTRRTGDTAEKMEIARFSGHEIVAERVGEDLVIYQIGDPDGIGVLVAGSTADRAPQTTADLQVVYDKAYARPETPRQRLDRDAAGRALADSVRGR